jgi:hypothetical protein
MNLRDHPLLLAEHETIASWTADEAQREVQVVLDGYARRELDNYDKSPCGRSLGNDLGE